MKKATLFGVPGSHPSYAAELMLRPEPPLFPQENAARQVDFQIAAGYPGQTPKVFPQAWLGA